MSEYERLIELAKNAVHKSISALEDIVRDKGGHHFDLENPKEMKAEVDLLLEGIILNDLRATGISILSEESGRQEIEDESVLQWIIDPLDGTVNFIRSICSSGVSIGLWKGEKPIFGVIGEFPSRNIFWGGKTFGAFLNDHSINVSDSKIIGQSILCSGFPSRYDFSTKNFHEIHTMFSKFAKIRMLGAASISILQVAQGNADAYFEKEIMIWDIAAALAILEGAGGKFKMFNGKVQNSHDIFVSNSVLTIEYKDNQVLS